MINKQDLPYRTGVGVVILNKKNKVFVGQRIDTKVEAWQLPQGGVDQGENFSEAMFRELKEEIGTDNVTIIARTEDFFYYDLPDDLRMKVWDGKYCGQKQYWYLVRLNGDDSEINLNYSTHPEFNEYKWIDLENIVDIIVPFKKDLYQKIADYFKAYV